LSSSNFGVIGQKEPVSGRTRRESAIERGATPRPRFKNRTWGTLRFFQFWGNEDNGSSTWRFKGVTRLEKNLDLPFSQGNDWFLVIRNRGEEPVAIHYELF
jgi:hypothetical protein